MNAPMSTSASPLRRGFALPLVILVLTLLALLAAAGVEAARAARRASALAEADAALQTAAEAALGDLAGRWPPASSRLAVGEGATFPGPGSPSGVTTSVHVTRVALDLWWVTAEARLGGVALAIDGGGTWGRRRVNGVLALPALRPPIAAPLVAGGSIAIAAPLDAGVDSSTAACPPLAADSATIVVGPSVTVTFAAGAPTVPWRRDPAAADATALDRWGAADWSTLAAAADLVFGDGSVVTAAGGCSATGWGTAGDAGCAASPRVVHATGDLTVDGGSGAGVLLVEGRLRITGAFRYSGVVVARGGIDFDAAGSAITGVVVAGASSGAGPAARLNGATTLRASRCAVWQSLVPNATPRPVPGRWWAELL